MAETAQLIVDLESRKTSQEAVTMIKMHMAACETAHTSYNKSLDEIFKLIRRVGSRIIIGLFAIVISLISYIFLTSI